MLIDIYQFLKRTFDIKQAVYKEKRNDFSLDCVIFAIHTVTNSLKIVPVMNLFLFLLNYKTKV